MPTHIKQKQTMKPSLHQSLLIFFFFFLTTILPSILTVHSQSDDSDFLRTSCTTTLYPDLCFSSLSSFSNSVHNDPTLLARAAISVTLSKSLELASYLSNVTTTLNEDRVIPHPTAAAVFHDCFENLKDAVEEMRDSMKQMRELVSTGSIESFKFQMSNVQTWLSAALTDEETCTDGFKDVHDEPKKDDVCARVDDVKKLTSNALALVNRCVNEAIH